MSLVIFRQISHFLDPLNPSTIFPYYPSRSTCVLYISNTASSNIPHLMASLVSHIIFLQSSMKLKSVGAPYVYILKVPIMRSLNKRVILLILY